MTCGWPLYRQPYNKTYRYLCGLYQQSHGARCRHNHIEGPSATQFLLTCVRQRLLGPDFRSRLEQRLREIALRESRSRPEPGLAQKQAALAEVERRLAKASENLALAENEGQYKAVAEVFEKLQRQHEALQAEVRLSRPERVRKTDVDTEVTAALSQVDRLGELAADDKNLAAVGELFRGVNARVFLRFTP
jgi:hypothetical protein